MTTNETMIFGLMVFITVVLLATAMIVPTAGSAAQASKRMRKRIAKHLELRDPGTTSLLREQYLDTLSPFEKAIERLPFLAPISAAIEQSGKRTSVAKLALISISLAAVAFLAVALFTSQLVIAFIVGFMALVVPISLIYRARSARLNRFEEQLPEALDVMSRALKAGQPFNETLKIVSEEMTDPIAGEFGRVFSDLNFGMPLKSALHGILIRVPSMSLHTLVTAILIQSESGGALAEILDKVASVIRDRFKLQRKLKTLSAEGRMSAWVLAMVPFALAAVLSIVTPTYLPTMLAEPLGRKMVLAAFGMMLLGVLWIRKVIRIEV